jgi:hypothetical protein
MVVKVDNSRRIVPSAAPSPRRCTVNRLASVGHGDQSASGKYGVKVGQPVARLGKIPRSRGLVVSQEICASILVPNAVQLRSNRLALGYGTLAPLEELFGFLLLRGARALAHRAAVHVVLHPQEWSV